MAKAVLAHSAGIITPADDDPVAVRVAGVSKTYALWSSPGARLQYAFLNFVRRLVPGASKIAQRIASRRSSLHREFRALEEITFDIKKGDSWGFIGVNGSGKSTLLKMISGNLRPSSGRIEVDGKVALLDYSSGLHGEFTGRENIFLKSAVMGMGRKETESKIDSIIAFADIGQFIDQPVKTYSSGMLARLGFAIIAHIDADIIITDEALAVGDAFFVQKCMDFIRDFLKRGTFLFVSHSTNDVISLCKKAIWLDHGHVRKIGSSKDVAEAYLAHAETQHSESFMERNTAQRPKTGPADATSETPATSSPVLPGRREVSQPELATLTQAKPSRAVRDMRLDYPSNTLARNDIEIGAFELSSGFGVGGAKIEGVTITDQDDAPLSFIIGGEQVRLVISAVAERELVSPIVGFRLRDRLGQTLFADNTHFATLGNALTVGAGQRLRAEFEFQMPMLPGGEYAIRVGIAEGSEDESALLQGIDSALILRSIASGPRHGLIGVPMQRISLETTP